MQTRWVYCIGGRGMPGSAYFDAALRKKLGRLSV
jgi:hypothetical protein